MAESGQRRNVLTNSESSGCLLSEEKVSASSQKTLLTGMLKLKAAAHFVGTAAY